MAAANRTSSRGRHPAGRTHDSASQRSMSLSPTPSVGSISSQASDIDPVQLAPRQLLDDDEAKYNSHAGRLPNFHVGLHYEQVA
jgi:hypothetical protein